MSLDAQQSKPPPPASYSAQIGRKLVRTSKYHILEYGENTGHLISFGLHGGEIKETISKRFCYCTLVCCLRFLVPAWNWWLMNNNSGEREIKITTPTNSELVGSSVSVIFFLMCFRYVKNWMIIICKIVPDISFIDQDVADVIAKYKWNLIPMIYPWKFDTCKKTDWCLANLLSGINHIILFFSVLVLFFCVWVFEWYASDTIYFGSLWWRTCNIHHSSKKHLGRSVLLCRKNINSLTYIKFKKYMKDWRGQHLNNA